MTISKGSLTANLTAKQHAMQKRADALGEAAVLAIGIDSYPSPSGFHNLKTCVNDAHAVARAFQEVGQLLAPHVRTMTSEMPERASRGAMVSAIKELASKDVRRLVLFFSGHGWRNETGSEGKDFYFVPGDAPDDNADSLLGLPKVLQLLEVSPATTKVIILDACLSGPDTTHLKKPKEVLTPKFLNEQLQKIKGFVILSASSFDAEATTKSPDPKLSLFTHFIVKALRGEPAALNAERLLTHASLFSYVHAAVGKWAKTAQWSQTPGIQLKANGDLPLGDFSGTLLPDDAFDINGNAAESVAFDETSSLALKKVIPKLLGRKYSKEWLVGIATKELGSYRADDLGAARATLRRQFGWESSAVSIDRSTLYFPGGSYALRCEDDGSRDSCSLVETAQFDSSWFSRVEQIPDVLEALNLRPDDFSVVLNATLKPESLIAGLQSRGWESTSELATKVEARHPNGGYTIVVTPRELRFGGFAPSELFRREDAAQGALVGAVLGMVGALPTNPKPPAAVISFKPDSAKALPTNVVSTTFTKISSVQAALAEDETPEET